MARYLALSPFTSLEQTLARLASGDMSTTVDTSGHGLLGRLQMSLNQVSVNLRTVVADTHLEISNLRGAIQEIASGNASLAGRTETQSGSLEQTASTTEQIHGTAQQSAESVDRAARLATLGRDEKTVVKLLARLRDAVADIPRQVDDNRPFATRRGQLGRPLAGSVLTAFGGRLPDGRSSDGLLIAGSEAGMVPVEESTVREKGALGPGQMIAVDGGQHLAWQTPDIVE